MRFCLAACFFFFFQAEDGIRDKLVTGVQTCALPISNKRLKLPGGDRSKGSGVLCPWRGTDCRPTALRRRASRPQLKRDPLGSSEATMTRVLCLVPLSMAMVLISACQPIPMAARRWAGCYELSVGTWNRDSLQPDRPPT